MTNELAIAVHTLVFLHHKKTNISSKDIAKNVCTNPVIIRKVLAKLQRAKLVESKEGKYGGYNFILNPNKVKLKTICEAVEALPVTISGTTGDVDMNCFISSGMKSAMDKVYAMMNRACLMELNKISLTDIEAFLTQQRGNGNIYKMEE